MILIGIKRQEKKENKKERKKERQTAEKYGRIKK